MHQAAGAPAKKQSQFTQLFQLRGKNLLLVHSQIRTRIGYQIFYIASGHRIELLKDLAEERENRNLQLLLT